MHNIASWMRKGKRRGAMYISIDTNLLISHLKFVKDMAKVIKKRQDATLLIPWMVI